LRLVLSGYLQTLTTQVDLSFRFILTVRRSEGDHLPDWRRGLARDLIFHNTA